MIAFRQRALRWRDVAEDRGSYPKGHVSQLGMSDTTEDTKFDYGTHCYSVAIRLKITSWSEKALLSGY